MTGTLDKSVVEAVDTAHATREGTWGRLPWVSTGIIAVMLCMAVLAPLLSPHSPTEQSLPEKLLPPAWQEGGTAKYLLGTDLFGETCSRGSSMGHGSA